MTDTDRRTDIGTTGAVLVCPFGERATGISKKVKAKVAHNRLPSMQVK